MSPVRSPRQNRGRRLGRLTSNGMRKNEPLWLPKGSIRALIALVLIISTVIFIAKRFELPQAWFSIVAAMAGYYFGMRTKGE